MSSAGPPHTSSPTWAVVQSYLASKSLSLGPVLFSTLEQGHEYQNFRSMVADKGLTLTVVQCNEGHVLAGTASTWACAPNGVPMEVCDPQAVLFDADQVHPFAPGKASVVLDPTLGPTWTDGALCCGPLAGGNSLGEFTAFPYSPHTIPFSEASRRRNQAALYTALKPINPSWSAKYCLARENVAAAYMMIYQVVPAFDARPAAVMSPDFQTLRDGSFVAQVETELRSLPSVTVGVCAVAQSGKSTLLNAFASIVKGRNIDPFQAGAGQGTDGQLTLAAQCVGLFDEAGTATPSGKEVFLRDSPGRSNVECLLAHLKGVLEPGEVFDAANAASYAARAPQPSPMEASHVIILLIPHNVLTGPEIDAEALRFLNAVKQLTANYDANRTGRRYPLRIVPVISKVDEWCSHPSRNVTDRKCLLARSQGALKPLFDKLNQPPFGFPPTTAYAIGWLNSDVVNYSAGNDDPVVLALKGILIAAVEKASSFVRTNRLA